MRYLNPLHNVDHGGPRATEEKPVDEPRIESLDDLAVFLGGTAEGWRGQLLRLIVKADAHNRELIALGFPDEVTAYETWMSLPVNLGRTATAAELREAIDAVDWLEECTELNFSTALALAIEGARIARDGWNGAGMWVALQKPDELSKMRRPYLFMRPADGDFVPWVASQTDLLADDWYVVDELRHDSNAQEPMVGEPDADE